MGQEICVIDYNAIYLGALRPEIFLPARPLTSASDFVAAGWNRIDESDGNDPAVLTYLYEMLKKRGAGTKMDTSQHVSKRGLQTVAFSSDNIHDGTLSLVFPDASHDGEMLTADGAITYFQLALVTDNTVYWAKKVSATGNVVIEHSNADFAMTPYEYTCFEDNANDPSGKANFGIFPLLA